MNIAFFENILDCFCFLAYLCLCLMELVNLTLFIFCKFESIHG